MSRHDAYVRGSAVLSWEKQPSMLQKFITKSHFLILLINQELLDIVPTSRRTYGYHEESDDLSNRIDVQNLQRRLENSLHTSTPTLTLFRSLPAEYMHKREHSSHMCM
jgi:hypothetical protein